MKKAKKEIIPNPSFEDFGGDYDLLFEDPSKLADLDAMSIDAVLKSKKVRTILVNGFCLFMLSINGRPCSNSPSEEQ